VKIKEDGDNEDAGGGKTEKGLEGIEKNLLRNKSTRAKTRCCTRHSTSLSAHLYKRSTLMSHFYLTTIIWI